MEYNVNLTDKFLNDVDEICDYISNTLKNADASNRLREKIMYNVLMLESSPRMFAKIGKQSQEKLEYRRMVIDNYVILYTIDEEKKEVYVSYALYGRRNYLDGGLII